MSAHDKREGFQTVAVPNGLGGFSMLEKPSGATPPSGERVPEGTETPRVIRFEDVTPGMVAGMAESMVDRLEGLSLSLCTEDEDAAKLVDDSADLIEFLALRCSTLLRERDARITVTERDAKWLRDVMRFAKENGCYDDELGAGRELLERVRGAVAASEERTRE